MTPRRWVVVALVVAGGWLAILARSTPSTYPGIPGVGIADSGASWGSSWVPGVHP